MKMISMANTPDEVKKDLADMAMPTMQGVKASAPKYPWGLSISLEDETLAKLGLDGELPAVGEIIHFEAIARVTSAAENERETTDGSTEQCRRIELQITDMGVAAPERERNWYGTQDNDNDGD